MRTDLADLTEVLLKAAGDAGAEAADAIAIDQQSISIEVLKGRLEHAERSEGIEIGLRVLIGMRQASVAASDIRPDAIDGMARRAVAMAQVAPEDPFIGLAGRDELASDTDAAQLDLFDPAPDPDPAHLLDLAAEAEAAARQVEGVSQVQSAAAGHARHRVHLAATNGFSGGYRRSSHSVSCVAITGTGTQMERDHNAESRVYGADLPSASEIGRIAGERAVARAGARKPPTGKFPVLFDERVSSSLIGHLTSAINGAAIARGASWARDLLGKQVLPRGLDLVEDPHRPRVRGSRMFDGEGLPTARREIVRDGILTGWTLDLATARKLGMASTASAMRGAAAPPSPGIGNLWLSPGDSTPDALLSAIGTGLFVTSLIGSTINPTTGDYSRGATGFWVEDGQIAYPVNECTVAGNLVDMLRRIVPANDGRAHLSRVVPSILVEDMVLAGA